MKKHSEHLHQRPLFENMPSLGDEAVWDLLELLHGLIDAYENHYAQTLQRLRLEHCREWEEAWEDEHQLPLPIDDSMQEPF